METGDTEDDSSREQGRRETAEERNDRLFSDILQELRVMQTGAQLTAGFLLTLPFQSQFDRLDDFGRQVFIALVILAALVTAIVLTPVAIHRRLTGRHVKDRLVRASHWFVKAALACMSLLLSGMLLLILDVVAGRVYGLVAGVGLFAVLTILLVIVPEVLSRIQKHADRGEAPGSLG
jgi:hypothetical protein